MTKEPGQFAKFVGSGVASTCITTCRNVWTDWDFPGACGWVETDAGNMVTECASNFTINQSGHYLVLSQIHFESSHNNRLTMKSRFIVGCCVIFGSHGGCGYTRLSTDNQGYLKSNFIYKAEAGDILNFQYLVDVSGGTEALSWIPTYTSATFIRLPYTGDTAYASYSDTNCQDFNSGACWTNIVFNTIDEETNTDVIQENCASSSLKTLKETGRYLVSYSVGMEALSNTRTQRITRAALTVGCSTTEVPASRGYYYSRCQNNEEGALNALFIVNVACACSCLSVQYNNGNTDCSGSTARRLCQSQLAIMKINCSVDVIATKDGTALQAVDANDNCIEINGARCTIYNDAASFTASCLTDINIVKGMNVLYWGNIHNEDICNLETSGTRLSYRGEVQINCCANITYGSQGAYVRNVNATSGTFNGGFMSHIIETVCACDVITFLKMDDGGAGGNDQDTVPCTVGFFAINLCTLCFSCESSTCGVSYGLIT